MTTLKTLTPDPTSPTEPTAGGAESLGAWLAQVRNSFNAEQREVARHLGLNAAIIEALESDHFERLGAPVFVRGYLSRYARLLNLPEQAVLERYRRQADVVHQEPPPLKVMHPMRRQTRVRDLRGVFYLMVVVAIAWAAIQNLESLDPTRLFARWSGDGPSAASTTDADSAPGGAISQTQYPFQQAPSEPTAAAPVSAPAPRASEPPAATVSAPAPRASEPPPVAAAPAEPAPPAASPVSPAPSVAVAPPALTPAPISTTGLTATVVSASPGAAPPSLAAGPVAGEAKLLLEFSNDCWVEVKDAQGNVLVNGLMKADSTRTLSGAAPFKVTLGNAPATRIKLDDRLVDTDFYVPRRGTVSRFTLARDQQ
ncbi:MAG: helix-turn-helix domain-containing protein [Candidatus Competibacteraceae bacterium]|nr:helix-turn-helix domain-containing protein [Candidatus Competibacteraceae bacterium]